MPGEARASGLLPALPSPACPGLCLEEGTPSGEGSLAGGGQATPAGGQVTPPAGCLSLWAAPSSVGLS